MRFRRDPELHQRLMDELALLRADVVTFNRELGDRVAGTPA
jgi:hypothetical protein